MTKIIINKKIVSSEEPCLNYNDRGFTLGHGLFETILVNKNSIPALSYHWRRLEKSSAILGISIPFTFVTLEEMIRQLIYENSLQDKIAGCRVTLTHGESDRGILPLKTPASNFLITVFECLPATVKPYKAMIVTIRKNELSLTSRIKSISYLDNILAKKEAVTAGYDEALLLNSVGNVADGAITNIFIVKNEQIYTPTIADGALPGVVRAILLEVLKDKLSVEEKTITPDELIQADEIFLTNALMGVKQISQLNHRKLTVFKTTTIIKSILQKVYFQNRLLPC